MKLFTTNNINTGHLSFHPPCLLTAKREFKFNLFQFYFYGDDFLQFVLLCACYRIFGEERIFVI